VQARKRRRSWLVLKDFGTWYIFLGGQRSWSRIVYQRCRLFRRKQFPSWPLIKEARELPNIFWVIGVSKVEYVSNEAARVLAQIAKSGVNGILCDSIPDCVRDLVTIDCNNLVPN
jgi:hypothetical protein